MKGNDMKQGKWGIDKSIEAIGPVRRDDDQSYGMVNPAMFYDYDREEDAKAVVRAVNSHAALVSALEEAKQNILQCLVLLCDCALDEEMLERAAVPDSTIYKINAALKLAKGD